MAQNKRISTVSANIKKNRLYITLQDVVRKKETESLYTDIRFCVSDLSPNFSVITDLSNCRIAHLNALPTSRKIMQFLLEKKVGRVVRIVGEARVIYLQILKLADKAQGYNPQYVSTLDEAEVLLEELALKEATGS